MIARWHLWLALCAIFMGSPTVWALSPHDKAVGVQPYKKAENAISAKAKTERDQTEAAPVPALIPPSEPSRQQGDAEKQGENGEQEGTEFWPTFLGYKFKITDSLIALSTLALTVFTGLLWRSTEKLWSAGERQIKLIADNSLSQARDMQSSIEVARASVEATKNQIISAEKQAFSNQRPWISVQVKAVGPLLWGTDNDLLDTGITIDCVLTLKNTGKSPATRLNVYNRCTINNFIINFDPIYEGGSGYTIFPGQELFINQTLIWNKSIGDYCLDKAQINDFTGNIIPYIVGCAFYRDELRDETLHQTGFVFIIRRTEANGFLAIKKEQGGVPADRLSIRPWSNQGPAT